jgi:hypothetical protein
MPPARRTMNDIFTMGVLSIIAAGTCSAVGLVIYQRAYGGNKRLTFERGSLDKFALKSGAKKERD